PYMASLGFVSDLRQLLNVNPTTIKQGVFLDPKKVHGERIGAIFQAPPTRFNGSYKAWIGALAPRVFNTGYVDSIMVPMNLAVGPPYSHEEDSLEDLNAAQEVTTAANFGDYLK